MYTPWYRLHLLSRTYRKIALIADTPVGMKIIIVSTRYMYWTSGSLKLPRDMYNTWTISTRPFNNIHMLLKYVIIE